jgi:hypothetical protein
MLLDGARIPRYRRGTMALLLVLRLEIDRLEAGV